QRDAKKEGTGPRALQESPKFPSRPTAGPWRFAEFPENDQVGDRKGSHNQLWLLWLPLWRGWQRIPQGCNRSVRPPTPLYLPRLWSRQGQELQRQCQFLLGTEVLGWPGWKSSQHVGTSALDCCKVAGSLPRVRGGGEIRAPGFLELWDHSPNRMPPCSCCFAHDCCYKRLERRGCGTKFLSYKFSNKGSSITCAKQDSCRSQLCQCDKAAASCFARNKRSYNKKYQYYSNKQCSGSTPRC
uniref:Phospholipase A2 n=1 Tax=Callithrix jacchus TaxID=9483 RepID=A0A5F4WEV9_CALJA